MTQSVRDLRNAAFYVCGVAVVLGGIVLGATTVARALVESPALQAIAALLDAEAEQDRTRVSIAVDNAREIRAALEKPVSPPPSLPPITATVASGSLKPGAAPVAKNRMNKLRNEAMDAMAMEPPRAAPFPEVDKHKLY